jgi:hypothetical protein
MPNQWFREGDLRATLHDHGLKMLQKVDSLDPQFVRFDLEAVVDQLFEESDVVPLSFDWDQMTRSAPAETGIRVSDFGESYTTPGKSISLMVPYDGDRQLFRCRAGSYSLSGFPFDMLVDKTTLSLGISSAELTAAVVKNEIQKSRTALEQEATWIRNDIESWRRDFRSQVEARVNQRRKQLDEIAALDDELDIPLSSTRDSDRVKVPLRAKRLRAQPVQSQSRELDPKITDANHHEILAIISNLGMAQERLPKTASKFNEEELRDLILFNLNANFAGAAKGEAFSGNGKTDIFLEWQGGNAFIAECKIWRGQKQFSAAIDQLLSYTVWRDSKAALVLFIRTGDASEVIAKAKAMLEDHPRRSLVRHDASTGLTHFMLRSASDEAKLIDVAFIPFVVVTPAKDAS